MTGLTAQQHVHLIIIKFRFHPMAENRARKSRRTLQNKVKIRVFPEQLTLFINTFVSFKKCIIQ